LTLHTADGWNVFELRQYTVHPDQRTTLVDLFDRELVESQEALGMRLVGQFRDLDRADRFVWIRGFRDMAVRAPALTEFYGGPVWKEHAHAANATMVAVDNVLLLRPATDGAAFPAPAPRPPAAQPGPPPGSMVAVLLHYCPAAVDAALVEFFTRRVEPVLVEAGARPLACLQIEPAENDFPGLPVRTGENVLAWFASFPSIEHHSAYARRLDRTARWRDEVLPDLLARLSGPPEQLRLAPTARSALR
jgi:NIPSNAP protein